VRSTSKSFTGDAGAKAKGLADLERMGFPIPPAWGLTYQAYDAYWEDREGTIYRLREELAELPLSQAWAVRSSANLEDQEGCSFAGQFGSMLRVRGLDDLVKAIEATWVSAKAPQASDYAQRMGLGQSKIRMGIVIQQMIEPVFSGVSFSRNPVSGRKEVFIEAVRGDGEGLVQRGFAPLRLDDGEIPGNLLDRLTKGTRSISSRLNRDIDTEWVYDGSRLWWLQVRPITTDEKVTVYSNRMSKEMLPGAVKPLVWSVNIPMINGAWIAIFRELTGRSDLDPFTLSKMFHYRVYFNMGEIGKIWESLGLPSDSLEKLTLEGMGKDMNLRATPQSAAGLPRIVLFCLDKLGWPGKTERYISSHELACRVLIADNLTAMSDSQLMQRYEHLCQVNGEAAYHNIITMMLSAMFTSVVKRMLEKNGSSLEGTEWNDLEREQMEFYPHSRLIALNALLASLPPSVRSKVEREGPMAVEGLDGSGPFIAEWKGFVERFGHLSESGNDLTQPPWRERPSEVVKIMQAAYDGQRRSERIPLSEVDTSFMGRWFLSGMARRASRYSLLKERMGSAYALGYGLFRPLFLELGARLQQRGILDHREDIFYLFMEELRSAVDGQYADLCPIVTSRKEEIARVANLPLPEVIYGEELPPQVSHDAKILMGLATSRGYHHGRATVVRGATDFDKVKPGDIIVIPFSDVSWSTIFARASAVISESGGVLSHCSILAREFGIPSVVSVPHAMSLLDGAMVVVDGFKGLVYLDPEEDGR
jgi:phosphohistidine swiveling domain-containing protein